MTTKFDELNISQELKKAIKEIGHSEMFPIQIEAIPKLLQGKDIIGQAQTGTGKTVAFAIPIIERVEPRQYNVQAIVLVPTRELCVQVCDEIRKLSKYKRMNIIPIYGGVSIDRQAQELRRGAHVVVGTPGRVIDQIERGNLRLNNIKILVLDEADRMLDMGFQDDMRFILENIPRKRQTLLFSATMPETIMYLAREYMKDPELIAVSKDELTVKDTEQVYVEVDYYNKIENLRAIFAKEEIESAIIFCNTKIGVEKLADILKRMRYRVAAIHGNLSQAQRNRVLSKFRSGEFKILVATDVAARGLDIKGVSHIINYNMPQEPKDYVHRIGRTGRAGHPGKAIALVTNRDRESLDKIEWYMNLRIKKVDYGVERGSKEKKYGGAERLGAGYRKRGYYRRRHMGTHEYTRRRRY